MLTIHDAIVAAASPVIVPENTQESNTSMNASNVASSYLLRLIFQLMTIMLKAVAIPIRSTSTVI